MDCPPLPVPSTVVTASEDPAGAISDGAAAAAGEAAGACTAAAREAGELEAVGPPDVWASEAEIRARTCPRRRAVRHVEKAGRARLGDAGPSDGWPRARPPVPHRAGWMSHAAYRAVSPARIRRSGDHDEPGGRSALRPPRVDGWGPRRATRGVPWGGRGPGRRPRRRPSVLPRDASSTVVSPAVPFPRGTAPAR